MNYLLYLAVLPVIGILSYIYKKDVHKEPNGALMKVFIFGLLTVVPAVILEIILSPFFPTENCKSIIRLFINVFIGVAFIEEILKWLVVKIFVYRHSDFDETFDAVVYAVFASLGFACIENLLYVLLLGVGTGIVRAITAVPLHACTGIIMGYYIGKAKLSSENTGKYNEMLYIFLSILLPVIVHTIYDFLIFTRVPMYVLVWLGFVVVTYIICFILVKNSTKNNESFVKEEVLANIPINDNTSILYCKYCGKRIDYNNYCSYCGKENVMMDKEST